MTKGPYHHGDLRHALVLAALELVRERGTRGFTVIEAARRAGVSPSAPYRHFADRDALLAAAALQGFVELERRFDGVPDDEAMGDVAARLVVTYLRFAQEDHARFQVMFAAGVDKAQHVELLQAAARTQSRLETVLTRPRPGAVPASRAPELWAIAHGFAALVVEGGMGHVVGVDRLEEVATSAARAWSVGAADGSRLHASAPPGVAPVPAPAPVAPAPRVKPGP